MRELRVTIRNPSGGEQSFPLPLNEESVIETFGTKEGEVYEVVHFDLIHFEGEHTVSEINDVYKMIEACYEKTMCTDKQFAGLCRKMGGLRNFYAVLPDFNFFTVGTLQDFIDDLVVQARERFHMPDFYVNALDKGKLLDGFSKKKVIIELDDSWGYVQCKG